MFYVVPNDLADRINATIDRALAGQPCSEEEREDIYRQMVGYFAEHGCVPAISLTPKAPAEAAEKGEGT